MLNEVLPSVAFVAPAAETYQLEPAARYRESVTEDEAAVAFAKAYAGQIRFDHYAQVMVLLDRLTLETRHRRKRSGAGATIRPQLVGPR